MKKLISFLLSLVLVFTAFAMTSSVYAEEAKDNEINISLETDLLCQLGFVSDESSEFTTRAELASVMVAMMNVKTSDSQNGVNPFSDMDSSNPAYPAMKSAYDLGLLSGGNARPNDYVTYNEAVKMAVCMAGYGVYANHRGAYPVGFVSTASENGFLKGVKSGLDGSITTSDLHILLYNALHIDIMDITSIGESINYNKIKGETVLSRYHGIYTSTGVVQGVKGFNMLPSTDIPSGRILVDGHLFKDLTSNSYDMVGCEAEYYYKADGNEVVALTCPNTKTLTVDAQSIIEFDGNTILYEAGGREYKIPLTLSTRIMYNNAVIESFTPDIFLGKYGTVKFIDNGSDGKYDVALINIFDACVVAGIDVSTGTVYDYYSFENNLVLDMSDPDYTIIFKDEYGNDMTLSELAQGDVISFSRSQDGKTVVAYYSNTEEIGKIDTVSKNSDDTHTVTINGKEYRTTGQFSKNEGIVPGLEGAFRITIDGRIAAKDVEVRGEYGYLVAGKTLGGLSAYHMVKIFTVEGKMLEAKLGEKVKVDGKTMEASDAFASLKKADAIEEQLIRFDCDSDGNVSYIDTAKKGEDESADTLTRNFSSYYDSNGNPRAELKLTWRDVGMFSAQVPVSTSAKVFLIPYGEGVTDEDYRISGTTYFVHDNNYAFECFRSVDRYIDSEVAVCKVKPGGAGVPSDLAISLVSDVSEVIDPEGETRTRITLMTDGAEKSYYARNNEVLNIASLVDSSKNHNLKCGDVVKAATNNLGEITAIELYYDIENDKFRYGEWENTSKLLETFRVSMGEIYYQAGGVIQMHLGPIPEGTTDLGYEELEAFRSGRYTIYTYDSDERENKVRVGSVNDITDYKTAGYGTKAIAYSRSGQRGVIILYI